MAKDKGKKKNKKKLETAEVQDVVATTEASEPKPKMSAKEFEKEMEKLQVELVKMQEWVKATGAKGLRGVRRARYGREGWCHQAHHRTHQPARLPGGGPLGAHRP